MFKGGVPAIKTTLLISGSGRSILTADSVTQQLHEAEFESLRFTWTSSKNQKCEKYLQTSADCFFFIPCTDGFPQEPSSFWRALKSATDFFQALPPSEAALESACHVVVTVC